MILPELESVVNASTANPRKRKLCRSWKKKVISGLQLDARRIIEYGFYRAIHNNAVRHAFSYDSRIVSCIIVYVIFLIVIA